MSKGLEALKTIGDLDYIDEYDCRDGSLKHHFNKEFKAIEKGLKALEVILENFDITLQHFFGGASLVRISKKGEVSNSIENWMKQEKADLISEVLK